MQVAANRCGAERALVDVTQRARGDAVEGAGLGEPLDSAAVTGHGVHGGDGDRGRRHQDERSDDDEGQQP